MKNLVIATLIFVLPFCPIMDTTYTNPVSPITCGDQANAVPWEVYSISVVEKPPYYISTYKKDGYTYITEKSLQSICEYIGELYSLDPILLQAIAFTESSYRINPNENGLCQIMKQPNKDRMKKLGVTDRLDPYQNVLCCADIIKDLLNKTNNDLTFALMSYNCGYYKAKELYPNTVTSYPKKVMKNYKRIKGE